jgi:hypothetical protein
MRSESVYGTIYTEHKGANMTMLTAREDYINFTQWCRDLVSMTDSKQSREDFLFQAIRHGIHDLKPVYSGYTSLAAIKAFGGRVTHMTREHYNGRANSSRKIIQMIREGVADEDLFDFVLKSCKVHYTTKEENQRLVQYQNAENYSWQEGYRKAGIKLVRYDGIKTWYLIDGIKYYKSKLELADILGVTLYRLDRLIEGKGEELAIF